LYAILLLFLPPPPNHHHHHHQQPQFLFTYKSVGEKSAWACGSQSFRTNFGNHTSKNAASYLRKPEKHCCENSKNSLLVFTPSHVITAVPFGCIQNRLQQQNTENTKMWSKHIILEHFTWTPHGLIKSWIQIPAASNHKVVSMCIFSLVRQLH
jgi:hypothetical protein